MGPQICHVIFRPMSVLRPIFDVKRIASALFYWFPAESGPNLHQSETLVTFS